MTAERALPAEEQARADFYGLLARLWYAPPDRELLGALGAAPELVAEGDSALARAWRELTGAAAALDAGAAGREHFALFVGTGRSPVSPYAGAYLTGSAFEHPLVALRGFLAAHGLARHASVSEPEDHMAALCDVMRYLVQSAPDFALQREFFERFLWPAAPGFCDAAAAAEGAAFYVRVAGFARCFLELEHTAFDMH